MAVVALALGACSPEDKAALPTPVPTDSVSAADALCGLDPDAVDAVTGLPADTSDDGLEGVGSDVRGFCEIHGDGMRTGVAWLAVDDASSEDCLQAREIVEGRGGWAETAPFGTLEGGVWAQVEQSDQQRSVGPTSVAFVGDLCVTLNLAALAPGRDPVREAEALTMQAIATLGLDGS